MSTNSLLKNFLSKNINFSELIGVEFQLKIPFLDTLPAISLYYYESPTVKPRSVKYIRRLERTLFSATASNNLREHHFFSQLNLGLPCGLFLLINLHPQRSSTFNSYQTIFMPLQILITTPS